MERVGRRGAVIRPRQHPVDGTPPGRARPRLLVIVLALALMAELVVQAQDGAYAQSAAVGSWKTTSSMGVARTGHMATVLDAPRCREGTEPPPWCGHVLVMAGNPFDAWGSAELYDPQGGTWTATGGLRSRRGSRSASALLSDGRVLVVGGERDGKTAELYDPDSGDWEYTATPPANISNLTEHTATLLDGPKCRAPAPPAYCGKVLVAGVAAPVRRFAFLYDPKNDSWRETGPMLETRAKASAVLLDGGPCHATEPPAWCGKVLVAGGGNQYGSTPEAIRTAELYDPGTERWMPTGLLAASTVLQCDTSTPCQDATPLPNGEVLLTGGVEDLTVPDPDKPLARGVVQENPGHLVQRYDPESNSWRLAAPSSGDRRRAPGVLLPDGRVLVTGGILGISSSTGDSFLDSAEVYDPERDTWTNTDELIVPHGSHTATVLGDGRVLVVGGLSTPRTNEATVVAEIFDVSASSPPPSVVSLDPSGGRTGGGTSVTIRGAGFSFVTAVTFGEHPALRYIVEDHRTVVAIAPAQTAGVVDVTVTTPVGTSSPGSQARFSYVPQGEGWSATEPSLGRLEEHTATLIAGQMCSVQAPPSDCGKVVVVGGDATDGRPPEIYDPATGRWQDAEAPGQTRLAHSATALPSGDILFVGGRSQRQFGSPPLGSVQLYRPDLRSWETLPPLPTPRFGHTATILANGDVLVAGGYRLGDPEFDVVDGEAPADVPALTRRSNVVTGTVEILNVVSRQWRNAPSLARARTDHTATALADGRVLIAGGADGAAAGEASSEIYDPRTGAWTAISPMSSARWGHSATLLTGPACAAPGAANSCGKVLVTGGGPGDVPSELFDPVTGAWAPSEAPGRARRSHSATLLASGRVLIAGGDAAHASTSAAQLYDPRTGRWSVTASMLAARAGHPAVLLPNGGVLVAGGDASSSAGELYDEALDVPHPPVIAGIDPPVVPSGPTSATTVRITGRGFSATPRVHFDDRPVVVTFASENRIDVVAPANAAQGSVSVKVLAESGGVRAASQPARLTFGGGAWSPRGSAGRRYLHTASNLLDGRVLVTGGTTQYYPCPQCGTPAEPLSSTTLYDPSTRNWAPAPDLLIARYLHTATVLENGKVLVAGGQDPVGAATPTAEIFDPLTGAWSPAAPMATPRFSHTATRLHDGRVLVVGGATHEYERTKSHPTAELYDPRTGMWTPTGMLAGQRANHTATLLQDGSVLVTGGIAPEEQTASGAEALASAELFNPASGRWGSTTPMNVERYDHSATVLSGPACSAPGAKVRCGTVVVAGGRQENIGAQSSVELYDPGTRSWVAAPHLVHRRSGHTDTLLPSGEVLLTGSGVKWPDASIHGPTTSAEVFDPSRGRWSLTLPLASARAAHTASPLPDGTVLIVAGYSEIDPGTGFPGRFPVVEEFYLPAPTVTSVTPAGGTTVGGRPLSIGGTSLDRVHTVTVGGRKAPFTLDSFTALRAVTPAQDRGPADVVAINAGGTSATLDRLGQALYTYRGIPGEVVGLAAEAVSSRAVDLKFDAADDGSGVNLATDYVIKQSAAPITSEADFDASSALCGGICSFPPGLRVQLRVDDLDPGASYHYAVRARNEDGELGPISRSVMAITNRALSTCPGVATPGTGQVLFSGGRYHLVGVPTGTLIASASPLYGWRDQGAGGAYSVLDGSKPVSGLAAAFWSWSPCDRLVTLAGSGAREATSSLGAYHASMIGNPVATSTATVSGHDYAARWEPELNNGAGGYRISSYREAQELAPGQGTWVFSFVPTVVLVRSLRPEEGQP